MRFPFAACAGLVVVLGCQAHMGQAGRNLRRDDTMLGAMVMARVVEERASDFRQVDIGVHEGVVSLRGEVASAAEKRRLGRLIRHVPGVRGVRNGLQVQKQVSEIKEEGA